MKPDVGDHRPAGGQNLHICPGEIHLWLADYDAMGPEDLALAASLLSDDEQRQAPRFYFTRDTHRYTATRALVRSVLSRYLRCKPQDLNFSANAYGRPFIAGLSQDAASLDFNISHTHSMIVLALARGRALGVDVENTQARSVSLEITDRFFSPAEACDLRRAPPDHQQDRFFEYWTMKEAYIKARGMGLSIPLDKFSFHFPDAGHVELAIDPCLEDCASRWAFWQLRPAAGYIVAICAERTTASPPNLQIREWRRPGMEMSRIPMVSRKSD